MPRYLWARTTPVSRYLWWVLAMTLINPILGLCGPDWQPGWLVTLRWIALQNAFLAADRPGRLLFARQTEFAKERPE